MREFISNLLGTYVPVTYPKVVDGVTYQIVASGLAGVDWLYVITGVCFLILVFSFFKLLGAIVCNLF